MAVFGLSGLSLYAPYGSSRKKGKDDKCAPCENGKKKHKKSPGKKGGSKKKSRKSRSSSSKYS